MSVSITVPGANFTKYVSKVFLPYFDIASGYYLFGTDAATSVKNLAYGASQNMTPVASPAYSAGYATITGVNGFDTGFLMDTPFTQICVAQVTTAATIVALTGRGAGNSDQFVDMMRLGKAGSLDLDHWPNGGQNQINLSVNTNSGFALVGNSWGGTGTFPKLFAASGGLLTTQAPSSTLTKTVTPTNTLKFGATYNAASPGNIAAGILFPSVLTDAQVLEIYNYLKPFLATRGVTVL